MTECYIATWKLLVKQCLSSLKQPLSGLLKALLQLPFLKSYVSSTSLPRNSRPDVFCRKGVLRNFTKFTGKYLCQQSLFSIKLQTDACSLLKKRLWHRFFPVNLAKFLRTRFFTEHFGWLLLITLCYFIFVSFVGSILACT